MKENKKEIEQELKQLKNIPLHLRHVTFSEILITGKAIKVDRIMRVKSKKMQTDHYFIQPFRKNISQF